MSDHATSKHHIPLLQQVADEDVRFVKEKDASYGSSWKQRGGVGAYMMIVRKFDRLENILKVWSHKHPGESDYDIFAGIRADYSGQDGSIIAEVRDARRYLLLVEAEMLARRNYYEGTIPTAFLTGHISMDVRDRIVSDWTGLTVRFSPSASGLTGALDEMQGEVITDIAGRLKVQCGPGLGDLYDVQKDQARVWDGVERRVPRQPCGDYRDPTGIGVCDCGFEKSQHQEEDLYSGLATKFNVTRKYVKDLLIRCAYSEGKFPVDLVDEAIIHAAEAIIIPKIRARGVAESEKRQIRNGSVPVEDSSRHSERDIESYVRMPHMPGGLRTLISHATYMSIPTTLQMQYVVTGEHAQIDRSRMTDVDRDKLGKFPIQMTP